MGKEPIDNIITKITPKTVMKLLSIEYVLLSLIDSGDFFSLLKGLTTIFEALSSSFLKKDETSQASK